MALIAAFDAEAMVRDQGGMVKALDGAYCCLKFMDVSSGASGASVPKSTPIMRSGERNRRLQFQQRAGLRPQPWMSPVVAPLLVTIAPLPPNNYLGRSRTTSNVNPSASRRMAWSYARKL